MKKIAMIVLSALAIASAATASNLTTEVAKSSSSNVILRIGESETDTIADAIVTRADVSVKFTNDETNPWTISGEAVKNGNCGKSYSSSTLTMNYSSSYKTELTFDWRCYNYSNHTALRLFIDGVQMKSTTNSSYNSIRLYIEPGQHVIVFKDSIGNSTRTENYSYIKNLKVKEISPLETAVLTEKSKPLTFSNDGEWPWTIEDGYIQNSNYGTANSYSEFYTTFTIDSMSVLSFDRRVAFINGSGNYTSDYSDYHRFYFVIQSDLGTWHWWNSYQTSFSTLRVPLEPGSYTLVWTDQISNSTNKYVSQVRNIQLLRNWIDVEVASSGTLGVEVLYKVNILNDVEMLKVKGQLNSSDWNDIKNMNNLVALDLSEATIENIPDYAFEGLSKLSWLKLPEGLKTIGQYAFKSTQIFAIEIPSTVTTIGYMAFANTRLNKVKFRDNSQLTTINRGAFYNCSSLVEVIMPNSVTTVGEYAFQGCSGLETIIFSDALTSVGDYMCSGCTSLRTLHLPNNLKTIRYHSFYDTQNLLKVDLPSTVNRIYDYAFYNCGLDSLILPITLRYLHREAFSNCKNLKYIELPSCLESGSVYTTYYHSGGTSSGTLSYGYYNNFSNCPSIETVVMRSATPPTITNDPFSNARSKSAITLKVPSFAVVNYKLDSYWYQFGSIIEGDDVDYWRISSALSLTNNRRMQGKPDIDLYYGGQFTVGGNAPMEVGQFNVFVSEGNPGRLLNTCEAMTADSINSYFSVSSETWYFITPLHDVDLTKVTVSNGASYVFRYYDGSNRATNGTGNSWRNVDSGKLVAGQGYIFRCNVDAVVTFPAEASVHAQVFNTEDVTTTLNAYEAAASANKSWNFVGNPYPCYYDIYYMDFTAPITVWTGSTYKAYSIADDDFVLRPMQSFFVQKPDAVDNIVFHKEGRQLTTSINHAAAARAYNAPARADIAINRHFFNLQMIGDEMEDETRIVINDNASLGYEIERDASKFMSFEPNVPQVFTLDADGNGYAINERPLNDGTVKLAYYAGQSGFYTLSAIRADGDIYLHDAQLNKTVNLMEQDYTFHSDATEGTNNARFTLSLNISGDDTTGIKSVEESELENDDYYDLQGRKVQPSVKNGIYIQNGRKVVK